MIKSLLFCLLATAVLISAPATDAQQPEKILRIGYLDGGTAGGTVWTRF